MWGINEICLFKKFKIFLNSTAIKKIPDPACDIVSISKFLQIVGLKDLKKFFENNMGNGAI